MYADTISHCRNSCECLYEVGGPNKAHTLGKNAYKIQFHKD